MKRSLPGLVLLALLLSLPGCYWSSSTGQGSVLLELSGIAPKGDGDRYVRVWLVANDAVYPLGEGVDYVQKLIPGGYDEVTVTLETVPVGPVYRVWISIIREYTGGRLYTEKWAESAPLDLFPGARAAVVVGQADVQSDVFYPVTDVSGTPTLIGRNLLNVEADWDTVYAAESGVLHHVESFNFSPGSEELTLNSLPAPGGSTINSVSMAPPANERALGPGLPEGSLS